MVNFLLATLNIFRQLIRFRRYKQILVEVGAFQRGVGQFKRKFLVEGASPTNLHWYKKTRMITLSYDIKILAVCSVFSSQITHVTDRQTELRSQDGTSIAASRPKNPLIYHSV